MKRIRTISAMLLLLCAGICMAQNSRRPEVVWNQTISQYSQYSRTLQINEVRINMAGVWHTVTLCNL